MQADITFLQLFMLQMVELEDAAWDDMLQRLQHRRYKKKDVFIKEGKICRELAFVLKGSFRYKTIDGIEVITFFF